MWQEYHRQTDEVPLHGRVQQRGEGQLQGHHREQHGGLHEGPRCRRGLDGHRDRRAEAGR